MLTVTLRSDVAEHVRLLAGEAQTEAEAIVDKALRTYLKQFRREKIRTETEAFEQQRESLLARYRGEFIAMHEGHVIDHDPDLRALHLRIFARLGHAPVLLKRVEDGPVREWIFRSPRFAQALS